ncbi:MULTISPECIES: phosphate ABC transporter substrate-binding protein [unclassified Pseudomonas]|uniref:phosphate ABC transporter substrate-binding protein n=1 Tax=unclassified Pseudomonas TaxID=196821 RepID=UPI001199FFA2|nr:MULTISPECIES: phosphate ABC transporter substrate-binding protein [unclassified Pseudomonas]TWC11111.1 phosphate ABC transporter substrate-binding protein (PhoT family) [Pseudomonas sp. SJZ074]TWC18922.1 phosphate ABC transporter substrate-binding protein (PhoT family) [Pseudomonas sp. SJZ075]TWC29572.1 phosphate ABC transporter substrate-binding protein (PhoT family) [Pseudomonas sp. SJZ085]TWC33358.1 phosphate ABC transporter substrate-binding protein (PhoT family) [Pseudomonas sp. SJZ078]
MAIAQKIKWSLVMALMAVAAAVYVSKAHTTQKVSEKIVISGSSTIAPLVAEIAKRYERDNADVQIDVQSGGSSRGVADARSGLADIGMVSRDLKASERELTDYPIARDGIAVIIHKSNPIQELSKEQIRNIYLGQITNWKELGGADMPITVVNKASGRSTLELFAEFMNLEPADIKANIVIGENEQGIKTVANSPGAIGYVSIGTAEYSERSGTALKLISLGGQVPSTQNVADKKYDLSRTLNLVTKGKPSVAVSHFIDYVQSAAVKDLVEEQYFVSLK